MRTQSVLIAGSPPMRTGLILAVIALLVLLAATVVVGALVLRPAHPAAGIRAGRQWPDRILGWRRHLTPRTPMAPARPRSPRARTSTGSPCSRATGPESRSSVPSPVRYRVGSWSRTRMAPGSIAVAPELAASRGCSTGPRTAIAWRSWASSFGEQPACPSWCWTPTAPDPPSPSTSVTLDPRGGSRGVHPRATSWCSGPTRPSVISRRGPVRGGARRWHARVAHATGRSPAADGLRRRQARDLPRWADPSRSGPGDRTRRATSTAGDTCSTSTRAPKRIATTWGGSTSPISPDGRWVVGAGAGRLVIESLDGLEHGAARSGRSSNANGGPTWRSRRTAPRSSSDRGDGHWTRGC